MNKKEHIESLIESTLKSADAHERYEGNPFLFTRIEAKLNQERPNRTQRWNLAFIKLPVFVLLVILINTSTYYFTQGSIGEKQSEDLISLAEEYAIFSKDIDYINQISE